jgi:putative phage-type endonuclease
MSASFTVYPDRESWLNARIRGIGASEVAAVVGLDPHKSAYALWCEKTGLVEASGDGEISEAAEWGNVLEPVIAEKFARETGRLLQDHGRTTIWRNSDVPNVFATLDREIVAAADDDGNGVLEIKAPGYLQREYWEEGAPERHLIQAQTQLAVTGYRWGAIAALIGGQDYRSYTILRDDELIELLVQRVDEFMVCVRDGIPPVPDGSESTRRVLKKLWPEDSGAEIDLAPEYSAIAERFEKAKAEIKRWEAVRDEADNQLRHAIGPATFARVNGQTYSLKTVKRAGFWVEPSTYRQLLLRK